MNEIERTAVENLLKERSKYGPVDQQAAMFINLLEAMNSTPTAAQNRATMNPVLRQSLAMIALKLSRILCGDPQEPDHWRDIAGYATLVLKSTVKEK